VGKAAGLVPRMVISRRIPRQRVLGEWDSRAPIRRRRQGISADERDWLLAQQGGRCPGCGILLEPGLIATDHDHAKAALHGHNVLIGCKDCFRGLICPLCNTCLGAAKDSPTTLRNLANYLEHDRSAAA
jgi:Recombination endonuclease VII